MNLPILAQKKKCKQKQNKTHAFFFVFFVNYTILETFQELSNVRLAFFIKIYPLRGKLTYKNILFQDSKVEIVGEHFDREKGKGDEVDETILPFYATL